MILLKKLVYLMFVMMKNDNDGYYDDTDYVDGIMIIFMMVMMIVFCRFIMMVIMMMVFCGFMTMVL